jgi:multimeric flavodoxin WrbA
MKKLALYYSSDEKTEEIAKTKIKELNLKPDALAEIKELKKRSKFNIMTSGAFEAMRQKKTDIEPLEVDMNEYGTIMIFMPVWGGNPAPAMNNILEMLPKGKSVELYMTSPNGSSANSADNTSNEVQKRGSLVTKYVDLKIV